MDTKNLMNQINTLPEDLKSEVANFVAFLLSKSEKSKKGKLRPYGLQKGKIHMTEDFNEPLEDFKDYM